MPRSFRCRTDCIPLQPDTDESENDSAIEFLEPEECSPFPADSRAGGELEQGRILLDSVQVRLGEAVVAAYADTVPRGYLRLLRVPEHDIGEAAVESARIIARYRALTSGWRQRGLRSGGRSGDELYSRGDEFSDERHDVARLLGCGDRYGDDGVDRDDECCDRGGHREYPR